MDRKTALILTFLTVLSLLTLFMASHLDLWYENMTALQASRSGYWLLAGYAGLCAGFWWYAAWKLLKKEGWPFYTAGALLVFVSTLFVWQPEGGTLGSSDLHIWLCALGLALYAAGWIKVLLPFVWLPVCKQPPLLLIQGMGVLFCYGIGVLFMAWSGHVSLLSEAGFCLLLSWWLGWCLGRDKTGKKKTA